MESIKIVELNNILLLSLKKFCENINKRHWAGRENEAVNLFAFTELLNLCGKYPALKSPEQIMIEVAVSNCGVNRTKTGTPKEVVRKDLVIWEHPYQTCWGPDNTKIAPLVIFEWKVSSPVQKKPGKKDIDYDQKWLEDFTSKFQSTLGLQIYLKIDSTRSKSKIQVCSYFGGKQLSEFTT